MGTKIKALKLLKDSWNKSVKARKEVKPASAGIKRDVVSPSSPPAQKKTKTEKSTFSSLLQKVKPAAPPKVADAIAKAEAKSQKDLEQLPGSANKSKNSCGPIMLCFKFETHYFFLFQATSSVSGPNSKKQKRVKWSDHFGGNITSYLDGSAVETKADGGESSEISMSDRRKRDRLREKELLAKAK